VVVAVPLGAFEVGGHHRLAGPQRGGQLHLDSGGLGVGQLQRHVLAEEQLHVDEDGAAHLAMAQPAVLDPPAGHGRASTPHTRSSNSASRSSISPAKARRMSLAPDQRMLRANKMARMGSKGN